MTDIRPLNLASLSADMEWRVVVTSANDSITYANGGIESRASGGAGLGPFPSPPDDEVLRTTDSIVITTLRGESMSVEPEALLAIGPLLRNARAAIVAVLGGAPGLAVDILPTADGTLPSAGAVSHSNHSGGYPRQLAGVTGLRFVRCVDCDLCFVGT